MKATLLTLPLWPVPTTDACAWALVAALIVSAFVAAGRRA